MIHHCFWSLKGVDDPQKVIRPCIWVGGSHPGYVEGVRETGKVRGRHQSLLSGSDSTFQLVISIVREVGSSRNEDAHYTVYCQQSCGGWTVPLESEHTQ